MQIPKKSDSQYLIIIASFIVLLLLWETTSSLSTKLSFILPKPSQIFLVFIKNSDRLLFHARATFQEMFLGLSLALLASFPLAWIMLVFKKSHTLLQPFFLITQCLPTFTCVPILVLLFGWGLLPIVLPSALMILFPLTINIYQGLRSTPQAYVEFFQTLHATPLQTFFKLRLPWALPNIFAGLRISAAIAGITAIASEWAGAQKGLGILMLETRRNVDLEITFAALFSLIFLSAFFYAFIAFLEKNYLFFNSPPISTKKMVSQKGRRLKWGISFFCLGTLLGIFDLFHFTPKTEKTKNFCLLLDWLPNPNHIPLYVGLEKGFFDIGGKNIEIRQLNEEGDGIAYLTAHRADILVNHLPEVLVAANKGGDIGIIGVLIDRPLRGLIYRSDDQIQTPRDLSQKILGYCAGGADTSFLRALLENGKIEPKEQRNVSLDLIAAMANQSIDFLYGGFWNISIPHLESLGLKAKSFALEELNIPPYAEMVLAATLAFIEENKEWVLSFRQALQKSIDYCKQHPMEAFEIYFKHNPDKTAGVILWEKKAWEMTYPILACSQELSGAQVIPIYHWLVAKDIIHHIDETVIQNCTLDIRSLKPTP
jgi:NitT/TauT family transport system substrate-binding protein